MTDIVVTQAAVRNLATILARDDTKSMKHTERLALIAGAFGWRADAFMHSLKQGQSRSVPPRSNKDFTDSFVVTEKTRTVFEAAITSLSSSPGVFVVAGPARSGKTTTIQQASRILEALGWNRATEQTGQMERGSPNSLAPGKLFHVFDEISDVSALKEACRLSSQGGVVVLASMKSLATLWALGVSAENDYRHLRGVMCQRLLRRLYSRCLCTANLCEDSNGGAATAWAMVADVVELDFTDKPFNHRKFMKTDARFLYDAIRSVEAGHTEIREVARVFGVGAIRAFCRENNTKFAALLEEHGRRGTVGQTS